MHFEINLNSAGRGAQRLSNDLAAIQSTPRILRANSDERIGPVRLEIEESTEIHRRDRNY